MTVEELLQENRDFRAGKIVSKKTFSRSNIITALGDSSSENQKAKSLREQKKEESQKKNNKIQQQTLIQKDDGTKDFVNTNHTNSLINYDKQYDEEFTVPTMGQYYQRLYDVQNVATVPTKEQIKQYKADSETVSNATYAAKYDGYNYDKLTAAANKTENSQEKKWLENKALEAATSQDLQKYSDALSAEYESLFNNGTDVEADKRRNEIEAEQEQIAKLIRTRKEEEDEKKYYTDVIENDIKAATVLQKYYNLMQYENTNGDEKVGLANADEAIAHPEAAAYSDEERQKIIDDFNALSEKGIDTDKLYKYYSRATERELNRKYTEEQQALAQQAPIASSIGSVIGNTVGALHDTGKYIGAAIDSASGGDGYIDPNSTNVARAQAVRQAVSEKIGKNIDNDIAAGIAQFLYNTGMSMADFMSTAALSAIPGGQAVGLTMLSTSAGVSAANDVINSGGDINHALITGIAAGIAEAVFEKISLEQLKVFKQTDDIKSLKDVAKNIAKGMFTEGSEEVATDLSNAVTDFLINADMNQLSQQCRSYIEQGYSETEAWQKTALSFAREIGQDFLGGAISGGVLGGTISGINYGGVKLEQAQINKDSAELGKIAMEDENFELELLLTQAENSGNEKAQNIAKSIKKSIEKSNGEYKAAAADVGNLIKLLSADTIEGAMSDENVATDNTVSEAQRTQQATESNINKIEAVKAVDNTVAANNNEVGSGEVTAFGLSHKNGISAITNAGQSIVIVGIDSSASEYGGGENTVTLRTNDGQRVSASEVTVNDPAINSLINAAANFDTKGAQTLVQYYEGYTDYAGANASLESYVNDFATLYEIGKSGAGYAAVLSNRKYKDIVNRMGTVSAKAAVSAGYMDGNEYFKSESNKVQRVRLADGSTGHVSVKKGLTFDTEQLDVLEAIAIKTGRDIIVTDDLPETEDGRQVNGQYADGKIYLNANINSYMIATALHESVHNMAERSPQDYKSLQDFVFNYYVAVGESVDMLRYNIKSNWQDKAVSDAAVDEEIVCQAVMALAGNREALEKAISTPENKSLLQKVAEALKKLAQEVYDFIKGITTGTKHNAQAQAFMNDAQALMDMAELVSKGLDNARNIDIVKNSEHKNSTSQNAKYSVENTVKSDTDDTQYLDAVKNNDLETAQTLVDEAAKENGYNIKAYHGTARADRVGNVFLPERATSGPMAFFTDSKEIASNYARDKQDTSLAYDEEYSDYYTQFRTVKNGKSISVSELWNTLTYSKRQEIKEKAKHVKFDDDCENIIYDKNAQYGLGNMDPYTINRHNGNVIDALIDSWLESGMLYENEESFLDVLKMVGLNNVEYRNPNARNEKVYSVYLNINNAFDTSKNYNQEFIDSITNWAKNTDTSKYHQDTAHADMFDKNNKSIEDWIEKAQEDINAGTTYAWTSIPDSVTAYIKSLGYDGIKDTGGKNGGNKHNVYIPFKSEQIKYADPITYDDNGSVIPLSERFNDDKSDIRYAIDDTIDDENYKLAVQQGDDVSDILKREAERKGYTQDTEWRMNHRAPDSEEGNVSIDNISEMYGDDIYSPRAVQYYGDGYDFDREALAPIRKARNKPDALITVYRAVPLDIKDTTIRNGDWVTITKSYANMHGNSSLDGHFRIIQNKVPAKYLYTDGNSIHEFGYDNGSTKEVYKNTSNNVKLLEPTYDDNGELIPLSKRFDEKVSDIRYAIDDTINDWIDESELWDEYGNIQVKTTDRAIQENAELTAIRLLKGGVKYSEKRLQGNKGITLADKTYKSISSRVMKDFEIDSTINKQYRDDLAEDIKSFVSTVQEGNYAEYAGVFENFVDVCREGLLLSGEIDKQTAEDRDYILKYFKGKTLYIPEYAVSEIKENYGSIANYRRLLLGKVNVSLKKGNFYIDDFITEVQQEGYGYLVEDIENLDCWQELERLINNTLQPKVINPYLNADQFGKWYESLDSAAIDMAMSVVNEVLDEQAKQAVKDNKIEQSKRRAATKARRQAQAEEIARLKAKNLDYSQKWKEERKRKIEQSAKYNERIKKLKMENLQSKGRHERELSSLRRQRDNLQAQINNQKKIIRSGMSSIREQYEESRKKTLYRRKLGSMLDRLTKRFNGKENNNEYIPEALKEPMLKVLSSFTADPGTVKSGKNKGKQKNIPGYFGEWRNIAEIGENVRNLADEYEKLHPVEGKNKEYAFIDVNSLPFKEPTLEVLKSLSEQLKGKDVYMLELADLKAICETMEQLEQTLRDAVSIIVDGQKMKIKEAAVNAVADVEKVKYKKDGKNSITSLPRDIRNSFVATSLDPVRYGRFLSGYRENSIVYKLFEELHEGDKKRIRIMQNAMLKVQAVTSKYSSSDIKALQRDDVRDFDFKDIDSNQHVKISQAMLIAIYLTDRQADGHRHLVNEQYNHYTVIPDLDIQNSRIEKIKGTVKKAQGEKKHKIKLSEQDLRDIKKYVESNKLLNELAGAISEVFNEQLNVEINKVSMAKYGKKIATVKNYFPLRIYGDGAKYEKNFEAEFFDRRMKSRGFTKQRVYSYSQIVIDDVLKTFVGHVNSVAEYCGLLIPIENFKKVYNMGTDTGTLHESVQKKFGSTAEHYIEKLMGDLQRPQDHIDDNLFTRMQGNYMGAVLLANPGAAIKQFAAFPTANKYFGIINVAKSTVMGTGKMKDLTETYSKYTPYLWYRAQGNGTIVGETSRQAGFTGKLTDCIDIMGKMDRYVVNSLLYAAELHVEQTTDLKRGTEEFYKEVARQYEKCIDESQPNNMVTSRPQFLRNNVMKILSMSAFRSQNMAMANGCIDSFMEMSARLSDYKADKNDITKAEAKKAVKKFLRHCVGTIESGLLLSGLSVLANLFLWHKWDDYKDEKGNVTPLTIAKNFFLDYFIDSIASCFVWGDSALEAIEYFVEGGNFYGLSVMSLDNFNSMIGDIKKGDFISLGALLADTLGAPGSNAVRIAKSATSYFNDLWNGQGNIITENGSWGTTDTSYFGNIIHKALEEGNKDKAEYFMNLWKEQLTNEKGKTEAEATSTIKNTLVKVLAAYDDDVNQAALCYANGELDKYEQLLDKVIAKGYDSSDVKKAVDKVITNTENDLQDRGITEQSDIISDLIGQGFSEEGAQKIYDDMQSGESEDGEETLDPLADTSEKGVAYTYSDAFNAILRGDTENYEHIKEYIIENRAEDKTKDEAKSAFSSAMKSTSRTDDLFKEFLEVYSGEKQNAERTAELRQILITIYGSWSNAREAIKRYQERMKKKNK